MFIPHLESHIDYLKKFTNHLEDGLKELSNKQSIDIVGTNN